MIVLVSKVEELKNECLDRLNSTSPIKLAWWSFRNNFNELQTGFPSIELNDKDVEDFITICDNRLDRAKTFLSEIAVVLGFNFAALTIVAALVKIETKRDPIISLLLDEGYGIPFRSLIAFLIVTLFFLLILLGHYRSHVHAWTAFKEKAILSHTIKEGSK